MKPESCEVKIHTQYSGLTEAQGKHGVENKSQLIMFSHLVDHVVHRTAMQFLDILRATYHFSHLVYNISYFYPPHV